MLAVSREVDRLDAVMRHRRVLVTAGEQMSSAPVRPDEMELTDRRPTVVVHEPEVAESDPIRPPHRPVAATVVGQLLDLPVRESDDEQVAFELMSGTGVAPGVGQSLAVRREADVPDVAPHELARLAALEIDEAQAAVVPDRKTRSVRGPGGEDLVPSDQLRLPTVDALDVQPRLLVNALASSEINKPQSVRRELSAPTLRDELPSVRAIGIRDPDGRVFLAFVVPGESEPRAVVLRGRPCCAAARGEQRQNEEGATRP